MKVKFDENDLKLIDDKAKKIISEFKNKLSSLNDFSKDNLEPIVNELIKNHETNFKGVGQPLRVALTGSKFGPGLYDIVISLGKDEVEKRLGEVLK
jgi:glutamyl-tRNA synthetase